MFQTVGGVIALRAIVAEPHKHTLTVARTAAHVSFMILEPSLMSDSIKSFNRLFISLCVCVCVLGGRCYVPVSAGPVFFLVFGLQVFWLLWVCLPTWGSLCGDIVTAVLMRTGDRGQGTGDGGDVTTLAGLATCSFVLLFILFSYSSDLEPTVHWHARFHYWLTLILTTDCLNTLIMLFLCYLLVRVGSRLLQFGASCNCVCLCVCVYVCFFW